MNKRLKINACCTRALSLLLVFNLLSCAVGPDFVAPEANLPQSFENAEGEELAESDLKNWWTAFDDSTLNDLIAEAERENFDLRISELRIVQAREQKNIVFSSLFPQLDLLGSFRRSETAGNQGQSTFSADQNKRRVSNIYQTGFDASWELDIFGRNRRALEAAEAELSATVETLGDLQVTLYAELAAHYVNLRALQMQYANANENLQALRAISSIVHKRQSAGFESALSVSAISAELASLESRLRPLEAEIKAQSYAIAVLLGREPSALNEMLLLAKPIPRHAGLRSAGLPSELLRRRPDIRAAEANAHAASARVGVAVGDFFPRLSLTGFFGFSGPKVSDLSNWQSRLWDLAAAGSLPIFNASRLTSALRASQALRDESILQYQKTITVALSEVENALFNIKARKEQMEFLCVALENSEKNFTLSTSLYQQGLIEFLDVLTSERSLIASKDNLLDTERNYALSIISLYKALGGGWGDEGAEIQMLQK